MNLTRRFVLAAMALLLAAPAWAARPAQLSAQDLADVQRVEDYLNGITTLQARFLQASPNGATAEGTAYISRPGKMRLAYDPPSPILVVADGRMLIYYDSELKETSYAPLDSTPAGVLVRPQVRLTGADLEVTRVSRGSGILSVGMVQAKDPQAGEITLVLTERPFVLKQWRVVDAQGGTTTVSLFETRTGLSLDPKLFEFIDPKMRGPSFRE